MDFFTTWLEGNKDFLVVGVAVLSVVAGLLVEFSKKAWTKLEKKYADDELKAARLGVVKAWTCQVIGVALVVIFLDCVTKEIAVPGGKATLPIWFAADYLLQYVVSCYGLKAIKAFIEKQKNKPAKEKVAKPKVVKAIINPETGELVKV